MSQQPPHEPRPQRPIDSLEALRQLIDGAEEIYVDPSGSIHGPSDPKVVQRDPRQRTVLKPQRWFARPAPDQR
jgi:hypothetical protein